MGDYMNYDGRRPEPPYDAPTPPKHEHEWVDRELGESLKVKWSPDRGVGYGAGWVVYLRLGPGGSECRINRGQEAAEIARLAGLTVPEDRK